MAPKNAIRFFSILAVLVFLCGCGDSVLEGDMFVVTNGRQNIPLGAATIYIIKDEDAIKFCSELVQKKEVERKEQSVKFDEKFEKLKARANELQADNTQIRSKLAGAKDRLIQAALLDTEQYSLFEREGTY